MFFCCCRVTRELDAVKQESLLLREQMRSVKQDIENVSNQFCHFFFACPTKSHIDNKNKMLFCQKLEAVGWCRFFHSDPSIQWQIYQKHILSVLNSLEACRCWWKLGIFSCKMQSMDQGKQQHTKLPAVFCMACDAASLILQIEQIKSVPVFIISCLLCLCHRNFGFLNRELTILYQ